MITLDQLYREGWLRAVDHALALSLRRLRPDTAEPVLVGAALASRALAFGHSGLPLAQALQLFAEMAPEREPPLLPSPDDWAAMLADSPWTGGNDARGARLDPVATPLMLEGGHLYLRRYWSYEARLAAALRRRCGVAATEFVLPEGVDAMLRRLFPTQTAEADDAQARAASHLLASRMLLLTGGPGTGKTRTIAYSLLLLAEAARISGRAPLRIALAAPTGKAAARLGEAVRSALASAGELADSLLAPGSSALTLHRLLGWRADSVDFRHHAAHPLPHDVVVVDEASMVDLPLMCKLVDAVAVDATLLLVGDRDQLPSVETGDVLAALCDSADAQGVLAPHRVALGRSWRQSDAIDVPALAALVRDGDVDAVLQGLQQTRFRGVEWLPARDHALVPALLSRALPTLRSLQHAQGPQQALQQAGAFRVLTALREGSSGSIALNSQIAQALQPPGPRSERFFHGALLIISQNSYRHGLYNGDVGIVWRDPDGLLRVWFETDAGMRAWLPSALPAHELAFALTVHKSQGSEFDHVLLVLPPSGSGGASRALSRELLYTGLTRCRLGLTLWADSEAIGAAVARRAQRWSGLARRLG